ncbi:spore coat putative kinase YutH [Bacillus massilinigeriensis]|uniref:spore coat putative kinase YutH n=1 Tax=Bacillus massilionigeriensis TaxID=1805475 RepID=UPI0028FC9454|nr:spore coat protein YutH [Bacillus massilionigeriensis]
MAKLLQQQYGIKVEGRLKVGMYEAFNNKNELYLVIPIGHVDQEELKELENLSLHLIQNGDRNVCEMVKTKDGLSFAKWGEQSFCVIVNRHPKMAQVKHIGRKLAKFHLRGRQVSFPVTKLNRIGQWKQFWETRLDQMEKVWTDKLFIPPENDFERMFLESFPYYMGLTENAIQYLVDTELDGEPGLIDYGTVCHVKFHGKTWGDHYIIKNPFDWAFDHCARDIAEWTRERYFRNSQTYQPELIQFIKDYQTITPLSPFAWRLLYARLLFPLHYFECVEGYYIANSEQQKNLMQDRLKKYLQHSSDHEHFLAEFFQMAEVPVRKNNIPIVEWLSKIR